jgi:hypothetical protein
MSSVNPLITAEHLKHFDQHGYVFWYSLKILEKYSFSYFILPSVIPPEHVAIMTGVIERAISRRDKDMTATLNGQNATVSDDGLILCSSDGKYFFFMQEDCEPDMNKIIFSTYMEQIVRGMQ